MKPAPLRQSANRHRHGCPRPSRDFSFPDGQAVMPWSPSINNGAQPPFGGLWRTPCAVRPTDASLISDASQAAAQAPSAAGASPSTWSRGGHGMEGGEFSGRRGFQLQQRVEGSGLGVHQASGDEVGEDPYAVHGADPQARPPPDR
ncbi:hypothetical protein SHIRM173S_07545 [Streptomyces hirsutus]